MKRIIFHMIKTKLIEQYKAYLLAREQSLNYANVMNIFLGYLEENKLEPVDITQDTLTEFFTKHSDYSISTKNQFIKAGRNFYEFLGLHQNEWHKIKIMKVGFRIPDYLSSKEIEDCKKYLKTYHSHKYSCAKIDALFSFLFATGIRKTELLNLKRADIDLENQKAKVIGKGNRQRFVYFDSKTKADLINYFQSENEETNFINIRFGQLRYITKILSKYLNKKIYIHIFRHSSARYMIDKGVPLGTVSRILGHASISTTIIYTDPNEETIQNQYKEKMR